MRTVVIAALLCCGCSGEEPQRVVIEVQGLPAAKPDPATAGMSEAEVVQARADFNAAHALCDKLMADLEALPSQERIRHETPFWDVVNEYRERHERDGWPKAGAWLKQQLEGRTIRDFTQSPPPR